MRTIPYLGADARTKNAPVASDARPDLDALRPLCGDGGSSFRPTRVPETGRFNRLAPAVPRPSLDDNRAKIKPTFGGV